MSPLARFENADWTLVPQHLHAPLERWLADGVQPKSLFLQRALNNDLVGAVKFGSLAERAKLVDLMVFLFMECPRECHGSRTAYETWARLGGLRGIRDSEMTYEPPSSWRGRLWKPGHGDDD